MANLLVWWSARGTELDDALWTQMVARLLGDSPPPDSSATRQHRERTFRAFASKTFHAEPEPLRDLGEAIVLASLRHDLGDSEFFGRSFPEPAAIIRLHRTGDRVSICRDLLGQRMLVWARVSGGLLIATCEEPLLLHPDVGCKLDENHIAAVIAHVPPADDSTPFANIHALPCGATVEFSGDHQQLLRGTYEPCDDLAGMNDRQLADRFRDLLEDSVRRSVLGARRIGVSLSSGLDAASIAAIVARSVRPSAVPFAVTYGWAPADGADVDERIPAGELARRLGFEFCALDTGTIQLQLSANSAWAGALGMVLENPYREIKTEVYRRAEAAGVDVLLAGHGADQFAVNPAHWLWSAWKDRRWDWISAGLRRYLAERGAYGTLRHPALRRLAKYLLLGEARLATTHPPETMPEHLGGDWCERRRVESARFAHWPDPARCDELLNWLESADYALESRHSERYGVDVRCPFRDWQLTRFVLSTPTYLMSGPNGYKWMQKRAAETDLDPSWLERPKRGDLSPLWRSSYERQSAEIAEALQASRGFLDRFTNSLANSGGVDYFEGTRLKALLCWRDAVRRVKPMETD